MNGEASTGRGEDATALAFSDSQTVLERIQAAMATLRRSERKVAEAVLADPTSILRLGMATLASTAGVSEPTVMRFCNSIGCSGFQSFKLQLAQALALGIPATMSAVGLEDSAPDLAEKLFDYSINSLDRARRSLDPDALTAAIDALGEASDILFVGFGASGIVAQDAQQKFPLFGVPCHAPADAHLQFMAATMSSPRSVTVVISHTGHTTETLRVARAAKDVGATVIAITGQSSPLTELADIAIVVRTFEDTDSFTPTISRLAALVVIDVLATGVMLRRGDDVVDRVRTMKKQLAAMRSGGLPSATPARVDGLITGDLTA